MSRVRVSYVLAFFGILITTGGCSSSATAPEAANLEVSTDRISNPTGADEGAANRPGGGEELITTTQSGYLEGGGRR